MKRTAERFEQSTPLVEMYQDAAGLLRKDRVNMLTGGNLAMRARREHWCVAVDVDDSPHRLTSISLLD